MRPLRIVGAALAIAAIAAGPAAAKVPPGFFGVVPQAPPSEADFARMSGTVETIRLPIFWSECEPARNEFDFAALDREVGAAAERGSACCPSSTARQVGSSRISPARR